MTTPKINDTDQLVSEIRASKIAKFINIMSDDELLSVLLGRGTTTDVKEKRLKSLITEGTGKEKEFALNAVADVIQSITTEAVFISEMLENLYERYGNKKVEIDDKKISVVDAIGDFVKIVHAGNYRINDKTTFQDTPFCIDYELPVKVRNTKEVVRTIKKKKQDGTPYTVKVKKKVLDYISYQHSSTYGILSNKAIRSFYFQERLYKDFGGEENEAKFKKISKKDFKETYGITKPKKQPKAPDKFSKIIQEKLKKAETSGGKIYNIDSIINRKELKQVGTPDSEASNVNHKNGEKLYQNKMYPSLAYVLVDSADLRIGTRNSIELATFLNTLSTIELSKCQPYFNAVFLLPGEVENMSGKIFKTASITQFLEGTPLSEVFTTETYRQLSSSFIRPQKKRSGEKLDQAGVSTNLSAFTMPQTINNFDEVFVGHNENIDDAKERIFRRSTSIHDYTRPFLTIKSFDIDVAPTQGLMSFKTGRLSLVLHDRTRMVDIAPFIKPDLFGSFGAEIAVEYGWSHIDADQKINYLGDFLNKSRVIEKYIITNSSFSMDKNGQINIDLSIAMRGPIDIKTVLLKTDAPLEISRQKIRKKVRAFKSNLKKAEDPNVFLIKVDPIISTIFQDMGTIQGDTSLEVANADITNIEKITRAYKKEKFKNDISSAKDTFEITKIFSDMLGDVIDVPITFINKVKKKPVKVDQKKEEPKEKEKKPATPNTKPAGGDASSNSKVESTKTQEQKKEKPKGVSEKIDLNQEQLSKLKTTLIDSYNSLIVALRGLTGAKYKYQKSQDKIIGKIIGGLDIVDPFYNKEWLKQHQRFFKDQTDSIKNGIRDISGLGGSNSTSFVTLGAFVTGLIGSHMTNTGKFDEIQIISYTANEYCGLFSNMNISSLLLHRRDLEEFLESMFSKGTSMTIESLITQVIERFINTRLQICYGLSSFYKRDASKNTIVKDKKLRSNPDLLEAEINEKLTTIYKALASKDQNSKSFKDENSLYENVKFIMPKVKFTFDTMTSKKSGFARTICRISIFDQNDNPFGSVHSIMKKIYDEEGIVEIAGQLNKNRREFVATGQAAIIDGVLIEKDSEAYKNLSAADKKKYKKKGRANIQQKITRERFYKKQNKIIEKLLSDGKLEEIRPGVYRIVDTFQLDSIKNSIKNIMPSVTYGSQNSAIIDANVTTVNEAKLNTVYLTRSDRNNPREQLEAQVQFQKDLPLRVLPSQANVTIYGCPFVNFAQYMFLDFETGTTIDNAYAITGIKHSLSPGKFTTNLTLSYGDVYGKYENSAKSIARAINENNNKDKKRKDAQAQNSQEESDNKNKKPVTIDLSYENYKTQNKINLPKAAYLARKLIRANELPKFNIGIDLSFYAYNSNAIYFKHDQSRREVEINQYINLDEEVGKVIRNEIKLKNYKPNQESEEANQAAKNKIEKALVRFNENIYNELQKTLKKHLKVGEEGEDISFMDSWFLSRKYRVEIQDRLVEEYQNYKIKYEFRYDSINRREIRQSLNNTKIKIVNDLDLDLSNEEHLKNLTKILHNKLPNKSNVKPYSGKTSDHLSYEKNLETMFQEGKLEQLEFNYDIPKENNPKHEIIFTYKIKKGKGRRSKSQDKEIRISIKDLLIGLGKN